MLAITQLCQLVGRLSQQAFELSVLASSPAPPYPWRIYPRAYLISQYLRSLIAGPVDCAKDSAPRASRGSAAATSQPGLGGLFDWPDATEIYPATDKPKSNVMAVKINHQFFASADSLWAILGTPDRVDWVPGVEHCELEGDIRSLRLPGAGDIKEQILLHSDEHRTLEYSCIEAPGPLQSHRAKIEVIPTSAGCQLIWQTEVTPVELEAFIRTSMEGCLVRLEQLLAPQP